MSSSTESFGKLRKDVLFHEKRMQLLLSTRIAEDFGHNLKEKTQARFECANDCNVALSKFERGASDARLSGRWDELKVANMFALEVPLRDVVGSAKFEPPGATDRETLASMIARLHKVSQTHEEFADPQSADLSRQLEETISKVDFAHRDVSRMKEALSAKIQVISELDDLANVLQSSGFTLAQQRQALEKLRKAHEDAVEGGEMALAESTLRERMKVLESTIDVMFFQAHTIDTTVETNVTKRNNNIAAFQSAAAMLECLRSEKQELIKGCDRDIGRIQRGMQFEDQAKDKGRGKVVQQMKHSSDKIKALDERQKKLAARLKELYEEFSETEQALEAVGRERAEAVQSHIDLVEGGRHATGDYMELVRFAEVYERNLHNTRSQYEESVSVLKNLESMLLQQQSFDSYDFNASAKRLNGMRKKSCADLNGILNDFERATQRILLKKEEQLRQLDERIDVTRCELELRKEVLDPLAKRYVIKLRDLETERDGIAGECDELREMVSSQRELCLGKIRKHLADDEIIRIDEELNYNAVREREHMVDTKEAILHQQDGMSAVVSDIVGERLRLAAEKEATSLSKPSTAVSTILQAKAENDSRMTSAGDGSANARGTSPPRPVRKASSRVEAVRSEVNRSKMHTPPVANYSELLGSRRSATPDASAIAPEDASSLTTAATPEPTSGTSQRRKPRVIGQRPPMDL